LLVIFLLSSNDASCEQKKFYDDTKRGWFWYEDPVVEKKDEEQRPEQTQAPSLRSYTIEKLWGMHPDEFQSLLKEIQKKAVQNPTEENVLEYLTIQDVARRKAAAYANVVAYVIQKHPELDLAQAYPTATPGVNARVRQQRHEIASVITSAKNDHALIYFMQQGCPYCVEQSRILAYFTDKYDWQVKAIDIHARPGLAARFGIEITPSLLLIKKGHAEYWPVSVGVVSLTELEERLYRAIRLLRGEVSPQEYSTYEFQEGGPFDPTAILDRREQPWMQRND